MAHIGVLVFAVASQGRLDARLVEELALVGVDQRSPAHVGLAGAQSAQLGLGSWPKNCGERVEGGEADQTSLVVEGLLQERKGLIVAHSEPSQGLHDGQSQLVRVERQGHPQGAKRALALERSQTIQRHQP